MDKIIFSDRIISFDILMDSLREMIREEIKPHQNNNEVREDPITRKELMTRLNITAPTVIRWEKKGLIPVMRIGNTPRYDFKKVIAALEAKKNKYQERKPDSYLLYKKEAVDNLDDSYLQAKLKRIGFDDNVVKNTDILNLKRTQILIKREIKKQKV